MLGVGGEGGAWAYEGSGAAPAFRRQEGPTALPTTGRHMLAVADVAAEDDLAPVSILPVDI